MKTKIKKVRIVGLMLVFAMLFSGMGVFAAEPEVVGKGTEKRGKLVQEETYSYYDEDGDLITQRLTVYEETEIKFVPFSLNPLVRSTTKTAINDVSVTCPTHGQVCLASLEADFQLSTKQEQNDYGYPPVTFGGYSTYTSREHATFTSMNVVDDNLVQSDNQARPYRKITVTMDIEHNHSTSRPYETKRINPWIKCDYLGYISIGK